MVSLLHGDRYADQCRRIQRVLRFNLSFPASVVARCESSIRVHPVLSVVKHSSACLGASVVHSAHSWKFVQLVSASLHLGRPESAGVLRCNLSFPAFRGHDVRVLHLCSSGLNHHRRSPGHVERGSQSRERLLAGGNLGNARHDFRLQGNDHGRSIDHAEPGCNAGRQSTGAHRRGNDECQHHHRPVNVLGTFN
jgi:hypothetical protein